MTLGLMLRLRPLSKSVTAAAARRFTSSTAGKPIECLAAVAWQPEPNYASKPALSLEKVIVAPPAENEVRVRIDYATLCGTDLQAVAGKDGEAHFPSILGHESSGTVESVGPGVTTVKPGDKVIPTYQAHRLIGGVKMPGSQANRWSQTPGPEDNRSSQNARPRG